MDRTDFKEFTIAMQTLAVAFDKEATEDLYEVYWQALKDLPLEAFQRACGAALRTSEWMPRPAHLRKLTGEVGPEHRATVAWEAVRTAIGQHGTYKSVDFSDPVINATIRNMTGGWTELGRREAKDFDIWGRKEFERIYQALYATGVTEESASHLAGTHEHGNRNRYEVEAPIKIQVSLPPPSVRILPSNNKLRSLVGSITIKGLT